MRIPVALMAAALLVGPPETRAEQPTAFGGLQLAPQGEAKASQIAGKRNPYSRLFGHDGRAKNANPAPALAVPPSPRRTERPIVKCGMTLIPGDPRIDPGIVVPSDKNKTKSHMRGIEPSTCW